MITLQSNFKLWKAEGINVNEETIALEIIKKVVSNPKKGVNFLGESHTREFMRKELYIPTMIDRNRRSTWRKKGSKDIIERAGDKVKQILQLFTPPEGDSDIEEKLVDYIKNVEKRTLDHYKNAEGISTGNVSLPGRDVTIEDK